VIKGYHAEEREEKVFGSGVHRLLQNVMRTLTATSVMSFSASLLMGIVGALMMYIGSRQIMAGTLTIGGFFTFTLFLGFSGRSDHADRFPSEPNSPKPWQGWSAPMRF
jgi:subfamily B ATP-binding cassette protein MsbA